MNSLWTTSRLPHTQHMISVRETVNTVMMYTNHFKLFPVPGVPYNVSVIPVTSAGGGEFETMFYFTKELGKIHHY